MDNSYLVRPTDTRGINYSDKTNLEMKYSKINNIQKFWKRRVIEMNDSFLNSSS